MVWDRVRGVLCFALGVAKRFGRPTTIQSSQYFKGSPCTILQKMCATKSTIFGGLSSREHARGFALSLMQWYEWTFEPLLPNSTPVMYLDYRIFLRKGHVSRLAKDCSILDDLWTVELGPISCLIQLSRSFVYCDTSQPRLGYCSRYAHTETKTSR